MSSSHLVIPDSHAHPDFNNNRADWLGKLIVDLNPDVVVNIGDQFDMPSLSSFDKGTKGFVGRNYQQDIESGLEFSDRLWAASRKRKRKMPRRDFFIGNHEHRIHKAIQTSPELEGETFGVSMKDLGLDSFYDNVHHYEGGTPGIAEIDGCLYAHYFVSGLMGRAISGTHQAATMINKNLKTSIAGHSHTLDWSTRSDASGKHIHGLVCGVYQDYSSTWAGNINNKWWKGVVHLKDVEEGNFTPHFYSIDMLRREYS